MTLPVLLALLASAAAISYPGTCREIDPSTYVLGMVSSWGNGEQPKIEFDWDNGSKHDDYAANDETYLLLYFQWGLAGWMDLNDAVFYDGHTFVPQI